MLMFYPLGGKNRLGIQHKLEKRKKVPLPSEKLSQFFSTVFRRAKVFEIFFEKKVCPAFALKYPTKLYRQLSWTQRNSRLNRKVPEDVLRIH